MPPSRPPLFEQNACTLFFFPLLHKRHFYFDSLFFTGKKKKEGPFLRKGERRVAHGKDGRIAFDGENRLDIGAKRGLLKEDALIDVGVVAKGSALGHLAHAKVSVALVKHARDDVAPFADAPVVPGRTCCMCLRVGRWRGCGERVRRWQRPSLRIGRSDRR